jgi:hypothetical protein
LVIAVAHGAEQFPNMALWPRLMAAANLHGMLQATTDGIHRLLNQLFDRSGTQGFPCVKHEFGLAMATLCNACIAWPIVAE